jgi:hypothetical protein
MSLKKKILTLAAPLALLTLSACVTGLPTRVSRFQAMPAPQGQSFYVEAADADDRGGLEFEQYARLVRQHMATQGYSEARSRGDATLIVSLDYGVDQGSQRVVAYADPFHDPWGGWSGRYRGFGYRPYYSRFGGYHGRSRHPFYWGWHDPFWGGGYDVESYTVYTAFLDLDIKRASDGQSVFEGTAQARSRTDELPALVPNLIEAMFTGFPGNSGETVRITVAPEREQVRR